MKHLRKRLIALGLAATLLFGSESMTCYAETIQFPNNVGRYEIAEPETTEAPETIETPETTEEPGTIEEPETTEEPEVIEEPEDTEDQEAVEEDIKPVSGNEIQEEHIYENQTTGVEDFTYTLDSNENVTITAYTGTATEIVVPDKIEDHPVVKIKNYAFQDNKTITKVALPDSITEIGNYAFSGCSVLAEINMPTNLTTINGFAFYNCTLLTRLTLPAGVVSIGSSAFKNSINEIIFAEGMTKIPANACAGANKLTKATLPTTINEIGNYAFNGCELLTEISLGEGLQKIGNNAFYGCSVLTSCTLPTTLTNIGSNAFGSCSMLQSLTIPAGVTNIGNNAFKNSISEIAFTEGMTKIPANACSGVNKLTKVTLPSTIEEIGNYAFSGCELLTEVAISEGITKIGDNVFYNCSTLKTCSLPSTLTGIGSNAFRGCSLLTGTILPTNLTTIGANAFYNCSALTSLTIPSGVTSIGSSAFYNSVSEIKFAEGMTKIPANACSSANKLTKVTIPSTIEEVGNYTFSGCELLTEVVLSEGILKIGDYAFYNCSTLEKCSIPSTVTSIGSSAFHGCSLLTGTTLPTNLTTIGANAFYNCSALTSFTIPSGVTSIGSGAFYNSVSEIKFVEGITKIPANACSSANKLTKVTIPSTVEEVGNYAFSGCSLLSGIVLPTALKTIGTNAFYNCSAVTSLIIPSGVTNIGSSAFYNSVNEIEFAEGMTKIPTNACYGANKLTDITIPSTITEIGDNAFINCALISDITLGESLTKIGSYAFSGCTALTDLTIPARITSIGSSAFRNSVVNIVFEDGTSKIPDNACSGADKLTVVEIPETVTEIGSYAFSGCSNLEGVELANDIIINRYAYQNCSGIENLVLGNNITIKAYAFSNCTGLKTVSFGENLTKEQYAFNNVVLKGDCGTNLTWQLPMEEETLVISGTGDMENYTSDYAAPWYGLRMMFDFLAISEGVTSIGAYSFNNCDYITSVVLPESVTSIGSKAFYGCDALDYLEIPEHVDEIGADAMAGCTAIDQIVFCGDAPAFGVSCLPDQEDTTVYYPETGTGWSDRVKSKYGLLTWLIWDDTIPSKDVVLLLDVSGSMNGKMDTLKESAKSFTNGMGGRLSNTRISIITYDNNTYEKTNFTTDRCYLSKKIDTLTSGGGTAYYIALSAANAKLQNSEADFKAIVLFSDGEPNDDQTRISTYAATLRKSYEIYTVGLLSNQAQRDVLVDVAGSEEHYFEATDIEGLLQAFLDLVENFGRSETTTAAIKRHNKRYDLFTEEQIFCVGSKEIASILITPGTKLGDVANVALVQNDKQVLRNPIGEFDIIMIGGLFQKGQDIYEVCYDKNGKEVEKKKLEITVKDAYQITYKWNDGTEAVYKTDKVIGGNDITAPKKPTRDGYIFVDWYASEKCEGYSFFSFFNIFNRLNIEDDMTLYAKWVVDVNSIDTTKDVYQFTNSGRYFCRTQEEIDNGIVYTSPSDEVYEALSDSERERYQYQITSGDLQKLLDSTSSKSQKAEVKEHRVSKWGGSCFGMSASVILAKGGSIDISKFDSDITLISQAELEYNEGFDDVGSMESMINYYMLQQNVGDIQDVRTTYSTTDESTNLKKMIDKLKSNRGAAMVTINLRSAGKSIGGHAVVCYEFVEETKDERYTFKIYDCSMGASKVYDVTVTNNGGTYSAECSNWESDWGYDIFFKTAITTDELKQETLLVAPDTVEAKALAVETENSDFYELYSSYASFTITDGTKTAVITDGEKSEGDLDVTCLGMQNEVDTTPEYLTKVPALKANETYTITPNAVGSCKTTINYDGPAGFYGVIKEDGAGTITVSATGTITTSYLTDTKNEIRVTKNNTETPWYAIQVTGTNKGMTVSPDTNETRVSSVNENNVEIQLESDANELKISNVAVDTNGISIIENANHECEILNHQGEEITSQTFGYSVVFDSQQGTAIPTMKNVVSDSKIAEPDEPRRDGYIFEGWFKEPTCNTEWNFTNDIVNEDTVLYAGWSLDSNYFVTVTFKAYGSENQTISVAKGSLLTAAECPEIPADIEQNWYVDNKYVKAWNFASDRVTENTVLYRKGRPHTISYVTNCDATIAPIVAYEGCQLDEPELLTKTGYSLCGWSKEENLSKDWNFATDVVTDDMTLYARWIENEKDMKESDTTICIDTLDAENCVYTGKAVMPRVVVRDGNNVLILNKDYEVTYKNNVSVCDATSSSIKNANKPQIIVQGIGAYKSNKKFVKYFSINQCNMTDMDITVPQLVAIKGKGTLQKVKTVVKTSKITVDAKLYTVSYYTDEQCENAVKGITTAGDYYIVLEAKKNANGIYSGNICGKTDTIKITVAQGDELLSKAKVTMKKKVSCMEEVTAEEAIEAMIASVKVGKETYLTSNMETFMQYFEVTAIDTDGSIVEQDQIQRVLETAGKKTITITAKEGNEKQYKGSINVFITISGKALAKKDFVLTYNTEAAKPVTSTDYTGRVMLPKIVSTLTENQDYKVSYYQNKKKIDAYSVVNAGSYVAVVEGMNQYTGKQSFTFKINQINLSKAYKDGLLTISTEDSPVQNLAGAVMNYLLVFDADLEGTTYPQVSLTNGYDYSIKYMNHKKASTDKSFAYVNITGKGNFKGTIKGDGKTATDKLNYSIGKKDLSSKDISVVVTGFVKKKGAITGVKYTVYDNGKKMSTKEYKGICNSNYSTVTLTINATEKSYTGQKIITMKNNLTNTADSKKVKTALKDSAKIYFDGQSKEPGIVVKDAGGSDITNKFTITYGENINVGFGTIKIAGKLTEGYYGSKTIKFVIYPKWLQWIFQ